MKKRRLIWIGIVIGSLLNFTGWVGNNFILENMWNKVDISLVSSEWRDTIWRHIFSFFPDFVYGFAIVWLIHLLNAQSQNWFRNAVIAGLSVSLVGGITAYFAIANSGFISWQLALASFILVLLTKVAVALIAGKWMAKI